MVGSSISHEAQGGVAFCMDFVSAWIEDYAMAVPEHDKTGGVNRCQPERYA